jgi:peptidoglycan hydrolase-like protein with peptidoglycan-binding domain
MMDPVGQSLNPSFDPLEQVGNTQVDPNQSPPDQTAKANDLSTASQVDPNTSTQAWQAHQSCTTAQTIEQLTKEPPDSYFTPDWISMDEFYAGAPEGMQQLDAQIGEVGALLTALTKQLEAAKATTKTPPDKGVDTGSTVQPDQSEPVTLTHQGNLANQTDLTPATGLANQTDLTPATGLANQTGLTPATGLANQTDLTPATGLANQSVPSDQSVKGTQTGDIQPPSPDQTSPLQNAPQGDLGGLSTSKLNRLQSLEMIQVPADLAPGVKGELRESVKQLALELMKENPDPQKVMELCTKCDQLVLQSASGGLGDRMEPLGLALGNSMDGAGAVGSLIPEPLQQAAKMPDGYARLDGARDGFYLRTGADGPEVEALQTALNKAGYGPLEVNGTFGPEVDAAVRRFQQENGCVVDGIIGPETMGAMDVKLGFPRRSGPGTPTGEYMNPTEFPPGQPVEPGRRNRGGALNAAISQIGVREASGNNDGVPAQRYSGGREVAWCANFVSWSFRQAGTPLPGNQWSLGSCDYMMNQMKSNGVWFNRGQQPPQAGDVIFFGRPGDSTHVGIVERVENGKVYTVEGNTGNRVARRSYDINSGKILGYGRP